MSEYISTYVGIWIAGTAVIIGLLKTTESLLTNNAKKDLASWLKRGKNHSDINQWPQAIENVFIKIFGPRHWSWKCFIRSAIISIAGVFFFSILFYLVDFDKWLNGPAYLKKTKALIAFFGLGIILNIIPDFFCLLQTRVALRWMSKTQNNFVRFAIIISNILVSGLVFLAFFYALGSLLSKPFYSFLGLSSFYAFYAHEGVFSYGIYTWVHDFSSFITANLKLKDVFGIFLFTTFLSSVWVWTCFFSAILGKFVLKLRYIYSRADSLFQIDQKPLQFLGWVLIIFQTVIELTVFSFNKIVGSDELLAKSSSQDQLECPITKMELSRIPPGTFEMGSNFGAFENEQPVRKITLTGVRWMARTECTQDQWLAIMDWNPSKHTTGLNKPIDSVEISHIQEFLRKLNQLKKEKHPSWMPGYHYRLPTEAEWEYSCRAGSSEHFCCPTDEIRKYGWFIVNSGKQGTREVATRKPNRFGLYDMHGNLWEWCNDWYSDEYKDAESNDIKNPIGPPEQVGEYSQVLRGGSWATPGLRCRSSYRGRAYPEDRLDAFGFRLILVEETP